MSACSVSVCSVSVFRVYVPRVCTMVAAAGMCKSLYALAFQYALWLANRTFSRQLGSCPLARLASPPDHVRELRRAKPFGCRVWSHRQLGVHGRLDKMDPTARHAVFVGMSELYKGWLVQYDYGSFAAAVHCRAN